MKLQNKKKLFQKCLQEEFLSPSKIASAKILAPVWFPLRFYEDKLRVKSTTRKRVYGSREGDRVGGIIQNLDEAHP